MITPVALAKLLADEKDIRTWSCLLPRSIAKEKLASALSKPSASPTARSSAVSDRLSFRWAFISPAGKIGVIQSPFHQCIFSLDATNDLAESEQYSCSASDDLFLPCISKFDVSAFDAFTIALLAKDDARNGNFADLPDLDPADVNQPGADERNNTLGELGFPDCEGDRAPVFALQDASYPTDPTANPLPAAPAGSSYWEPFDHHMHQVNNGVPANAARGRLFDAAAVTVPAGLPPLGVNASISDSFVTLVSAMNSLEEYFTDTNDIVQETTDSGLRLFASGGLSSPTTSASQRLACKRYPVPQSPHRAYNLLAFQPKSLPP